ncbi:MAG TPA: SEC-C domain-containing protein [Microlunatus sp.]
MAPDPDDLLSSLPLPEAVFGDAIVEILRELGCLTLDQLIEHAYADGLDLGDDPEDALLDELWDDDRPYHPLDDGRWAHLPSLLDGRIFTHRLTTDEVEHDVLEVEPDLSLVELLTEFPGGERLAGGGVVEFGHAGVPRPDDVRVVPDLALAELGSLILPAGTFAGLDRRPGDLVGLRPSADGIEVLAVDDPGSVPDVVHDYVLALLDDEPMESSSLTSLVLADVLDAYVDPTPPLSEVVSAWGVTHRDGLFAPPGFDWEDWQPRRVARRLIERYGLSDDEAGAVAVLLAYISSTTLAVDEIKQRIRATGLEIRQLEQSAVDELLDDVARTSLPLPDPAAIAGSLEHLVEPPVVYAIADEALGSDPVRSGTGLVAAAESLLALADRPSRGALHWLWAQGHEWLGDLSAAEDQLRTAERLDPEFYPTVLDLARLANDRGDAATGLALLARVPEEVSPFLRSVLEAQRPPPTRMMPRNEPCWCGSGRKFKACHLRAPQAASLTDRAQWLYAKGIVYALETPWAALVEILSEIRIADITSEDLAHEIANDGLVLDVTLFEGGVFEAYVETRGHLLPPDELLLAQQWLLTPRSAYEVVEVEPGVSVTFRDLRTGDLVSAADSVASRTLRPGHLVCCHLLPRPDGDHAIHAIDPIGLHERSALLELLDEDDTDPELLVAFLSRHLAPPTLVTTEGDPLILCEVRLQSTDPAALSAALDTRFGVGEDTADGSRWVDHVELDGERKIRATLTLKDSTLTLSTNSTKRRDLLLDGLLEMQPDLVVEARSETDPREEVGRGRRSLGQRPPSGGSTPVGAFGQPLTDSPEVRAAVAEHIRGYERRWLDEQIPALEGFTPREAANDPTRRDDLIRLLATFPAATDETQMDPERLRTMLGL